MLIRPHCEYGARVGVSAFVLNTIKYVCVGQSVVFGEKFARL